MDPIMLVYQAHDETKVETFKYSESLASFTAMCREFEYPYEVYAYSRVNGMGYVLSRRWPAQI